MRQCMHPRLLRSVDLLRDTSREPGFSPRPRRGVGWRAMDYHQAVAKATADMQSAERNLSASGAFGKIPKSLWLLEESWTQIRAYIQAAILRFQLTYAGAMTEAIDRQSSAPD
jgi:hypothetical protein